VFTVLAVKRPIREEELVSHIQTHILGGVPFHAGSEELVQRGWILTELPVNFLNAEAVLKHQTTESHIV
jgi:hypothetical protein